MFELTGKVAYVTGAAKGNGRGCAEAMCKAGATVALADFSQDVFKTAEEMTQMDYQVMPTLVDVTDKEAVKVSVEEVIAKLGKIDILVNNAGIWKYSAFENMTDEIRDFNLNVNVLGVWNVTHAVYPYMMQAKYGRIINMSSVTGPLVVNAGGTAYAMSKAAVMGFTKAMAMEGAPHGITCNAILPGMIRTPLLDSSIRKSYPDDPEKGYRAHYINCPLGRLGEPTEIGYLACFLATAEAGYITGAGIVIDGGASIPETPIAPIKLD